MYSLEYTLFVISYGKLRFRSLSVFVDILLKTLFQLSVSLI